MGSMILSGALTLVLVLSFAVRAEEAGRVDLGEAADRLSGGDRLPRTLKMDEIVVTPNRIEQRRADVPVAVSLFTREDVRRSAALTADDFLRQIPGFSLFRRSSSIVANPTTQGVSLRGIGPSGVSRTLLLVDGVPLNDPFGGWIYWSRIPLESIDRVEVVRGGGSAPWGNYALGGTIHVLTARPQPKALRLKVEGGSRSTVDVDGLASHVTGPFGVVLGGRFFDTDGYEVVREDQRGPIDVEADSEHRTFRGRAELAPSPGARFSIAGGLFREERGNGTPLTENSTDAGEVSGGAELESADGSRWSVLGFAQLQTFESTFSSQEADRSSESPALDQFDVPSTSAGGSVVWTRPFFDAHVLAAGGDVRWVDGETNEDFRFFDGRFTRRRKAGGQQGVFGFWAEDVFAISPRWQVTAALRGDVWKSFDGFRRERSLEDGSSVRDEDFDDRTETAVSPKVAVLHRLSETLSARGAFYRAFRAPTLNELVRPFRVRNDITEANAELDPERLLGGEIGADWASGIVLARLTGFWNELDDPIANVTVGEGEGTVEPCGFVPAGGVCRQRQNLDRARIRGLETEIGVAPAEPWLGSVSYLFDDAEIREARTQPELEGKRIAQVPRHQLALRLAFDDPELLTASVQVRYLTKQFEDDRNTLELGDYAVVDLFLARRVVGGAEVFVTFENICDRTIEAGRSGDGLVTTGPPFLVHGGVRIRL